MYYSKRFIRFNWITLILIYLVVIAGSFVRITGSGMGCPDWPKCFGQWIPPTAEKELPQGYKHIYTAKRAKKISKFGKFLSAIGLDKTAKAIQNDPTLLTEENFNAQKTWTEYINRLFGFLAGNAMLLSFFWILLKYRRKKLVLIAGINLVLMGIQAWFGSIVVASNLVPWTITVHLLLALIIIVLQLLVLRTISPSQQQTIPLRKRMKRLAFFVCAITCYQLFLGTQVREYIDALTKQGFGRSSWTEHLGIAFFIHRSFSWLVLVVMTYMMWMNEKGNKHRILRFAYLILALELTSGVLLAYANMPGLVQTSHLIFATVLFGILTMLVFRLKTATY